MEILTQDFSITIILISDCARVQREVIWKYNYRKFYRCSVGRSMIACSMDKYR